MPTPLDELSALSSLAKTGGAPLYQFVGGVSAPSQHFLYQEISGGAASGQAKKIWEEWLGSPAVRMVDGQFPLPKKPGLGLELSEDPLKKYPFRGTRPTARVFHPDGSMAAW